MNSRLTQAIAVARRALERRDANLAVYAVRDLPETKELGLDDLAWAMYRGYCTEREAKDLVDRIEAATQGKREPVLCYVSGDWAYFTTQELSKQWGDDWNDVPYEHNSGLPYRPYAEGEDWEIVRVAWDGDLDEPDYGHRNSPWSVQDINNGKIPWLRSPDYVKHQVRIMAGCPLSEFIKVVQAAGGQVYIEAPRTEG